MLRHREGGLTPPNDDDDDRCIEGAGVSGPHRTPLPSPLPALRGLPGRALLAQAKSFGRQGITHLSNFRVVAAIYGGDPGTEKRDVRFPPGVHSRLGRKILAWRVLCGSGNPRMRARNIPPRSSSGNP